VVDLGALAAAPNDWSRGTGINDRGYVVGGSKIDGTIKHGFLWRHRNTDGVATNPQMTDLPLLQDPANGVTTGPYSFANAINNAPFGTAGHPDQTKIVGEIYHSCP